MESPSSTTAPSKTEAIDATLHAIGFNLEELSPEKVSGRLQVTHKSCQVYFILLYFSIPQQSSKSDGTSE